LNPTIRHRAGRLALTLGVAAGALAAAASASSAETATPTGPAAAIAHPIVLAQATPPAAEATGFAALVAAGDVAAGQAASLQCAGCHSFGEGEAARFGPNLFGIVDHPVGAAAGFAYSPAMAAAGAAGGTWTIDFLNAFIESPQAAIPGTTMPFGGIADEATRANLIAYLATLVPGGAGPAAGAAGTPVTFTQAQVDRGERRYTRDCEECHGATLNGGLIGGPPLRGLVFEGKYLNGAPASALFLFTSTAMPPDNPGGYQASIYADLVAYILSVNGFVAGTEELPDDPGALGALVMTP
jgi:cytochrome c2